MKVVLLYPPSEQQFLPVPPLGIATLSSYLKKNNIQVSTIDLELEMWLRQGGESSKYAEYSISNLDLETDLNVKCFLDLLLEYDILCFSIMGKRQIPYVKSIINEMQTSGNKTYKYLLGGAFITEVSAAKAVSECNAQGAVVGEGWIALKEAINYLIHGTYNSIDVEFAMFNAGFTVKAKQPFEGLFPVADYDNINIKGYRDQQKCLYKLNYNEIMYQILVGDCCCPYSCNFCRIINKTDRIKSAEDIAGEMNILNEKYGAKVFSLICNEMNPTSQYISNFAESLLSLGKELYWHCYLRPDSLSNETIDRIAKAGCKMVRFGVESGSKKTLDLMNKKTKVDEIERILQNFHLNGVWNHINIMAGYLYETEQDIGETISFLERNVHYIDSIRINPFFLPKGSPISQNPSKHNIEILEDKGSHLTFKEKHLSWEEKQKQINNSVSTIIDKCIELDINFSGIVANLVATGLAYYGDKEKVKHWLRRHHPHFWLPLSPDSAKWKVAHPENSSVQINPWEEIAGKRGDNYDITV